MRSRCLDHEFRLTLPIRQRSRTEAAGCIRRQPRTCERKRLMKALQVRYTDLHRSRPSGVDTNRFGQHCDGEIPARIVSLNTAELLPEKPSSPAYTAVCHALPPRKSLQPHSPYYLPSPVPIHTNNRNRMSTLVVVPRNREPYPRLNQFARDLGSR